MSGGGQEWTATLRLVLESGVLSPPKENQLEDLKKALRGVAGESKVPQPVGDNDEGKMVKAPPGAALYTTYGLLPTEWGEVSLPVFQYMTQSKTTLPYVVCGLDSMVEAGVCGGQAAFVKVHDKRANLDPFSNKPEVYMVAEELQAVARGNQAKTLQVDESCSFRQVRSNTGSQWPLVAPLTLNLYQRFCSVPGRRFPVSLAKSSSGSTTFYKSVKLRHPVDEARLLQGVYKPGAEFPQWSIKFLEAGKLSELAKLTEVYFTTGSDEEKVRMVAEQREPVNIAMFRYYSEDNLEKHFGYRRGAYSRSTKESLMPNVAIYCKTPMRSKTGETLIVNVINLIGFAFDSKEQPDYKYFFVPAMLGYKDTIPGTKWQELVRCMTQMWLYAFECARRHKLKYLYLADVGGGAFSFYLPEYEKLKVQSLTPVKAKYDHDIVVEKLPMIPDWAFSPEGKERLENSLLVNAWDPWSMVGNGNASDKSLDGFFGRCTAMAILCWPRTNPELKYVAIEPFGRKGPHHSGFHSSSLGGPFSSHSGSHGGSHSGGHGGSHSGGHGGSHSGGHGGSHSGGHSGSTLKPPGPPVIDLTMLDSQ